jgi:hypothetical protein
MFSNAIILNFITENFYFLLLILIILAGGVLFKKYLINIEGLEPICSEDTELCKLKNFIHLHEGRLDLATSDEKIIKKFNDKTEMVTNGYRFAKKLYKLFLLSKIDGKTYEGHLLKLILAERENLTIKEASDTFKIIENDYNAVRNNYESNVSVHENETSVGGSLISNNFSNMFSSDDY